MPTSPMGGKGKKAARIKQAATPPPKQSKAAKVEKKDADAKTHTTAQDAAKLLPTVDTAILPSSSRKTATTAANAIEKSISRSSECAPTALSTADGSPASVSEDIAGERVRLGAELTRGSKRPRAPTMTAGLKTAALNPKRSRHYREAASEQTSPLSEADSAIKDALSSREAKGKGQASSADTSKAEDQESDDASSSPPLPDGKREDATTGKHSAKRSANQQAKSDTHSPADASITGSSSASPTTGAAPAKVVFNIAGINIPAYLADSSDPPPVFSRANKTRRNRRRKRLTADNTVFQQHQMLRENPQSYTKHFRTAPAATEEHVVKSLNEFTDCPSLVYAALLWKYVPEAVTSMAMLRARRNASEAAGANGGKKEELNCETAPNE